MSNSNLSKVILETRIELLETVRDYYEQKEVEAWLELNELYRELNYLLNHPEESEP
jgi:hypothetical protein